MISTLPPLVVLVKKKGTTSGLRSANLQSGGYGGWRPRLSSFAGRRRQVRGRWGAGCLKSLAPEEHFSRFPAARLRGRAVPCAARCGAAAMRSSFRLFVPPNGLFLFFRITHGLSDQPNPKFWGSFLVLGLFHSSLFPKSCRLPQLFSPGDRIFREHIL